MSAPLAAHLADRFASDARALRTRADALARAPRRGPGPSAEACRAMADACDRVQALFTDVADDDAVAAVLPTLDHLVMGARTADERHVYAGAIARVRQALDGDDEHEDDDEDAEDDEA